MGLVAGGRFPAKELVPYVVSQVLGGVLGAAILYAIASGKSGFSLAAGFASNGYGAHSPGGYSLLSALTAETFLTFMFLVIILDRDRSGADADSPDWHSHYQPLCESRAEYWYRSVCPGLGNGAAVAVLGGAAGWWSAGRILLSVAAAFIDGLAGCPRPCRVASAITESVAQSRADFPVSLCK